jgi:hypothetical protein
LVWRTLFCAGQVIYTVPGTLLVLISLHARFPSPELMTPPKTQTGIHHANELHDAAKRYLRSVLRPTIDLSRKRLGWLKSGLPGGHNIALRHGGFGSKSDWRGRQTKPLLAGKSHPAGRTFFWERHPTQASRAATSEARCIRRERERKIGIGHPIAVARRRPRWTIAAGPERTKSCVPVASSVGNRQQHEELRY